MNEGHVVLKKVKWFGVLPRGHAVEAREPMVTFYKSQVVFNSAAMRLVSEEEGKTPERVVIGWAPNECAIIFCFCNAVHPDSLSLSPMGETERRKITSRRVYVSDNGAIKRKLDTLDSRKSFEIVRATLEHPDFIGVQCFASYLHK